MWGKFVYREIAAPEQLVFTNSFADDRGKTTRASFSATWPVEVLSTLTFLEKEGKTTLAIRGVPINAGEEKGKTFNDRQKFLERAFNRTLDQLADHLVKVRTMLTPDG